MTLYHAHGWLDVGEDWEAVARKVRAYLRAYLQREGIVPVRAPALPLGPNVRARITEPYLLLCQYMPPTAVSQYAGGYVVRVDTIARPRRRHRNRRLMHDGRAS